jgi:hypothetical protein
VWKGAFVVYFVVQAYTRRYLGEEEEEEEEEEKEEKKKRDNRWPG